MSNLLLTTNDPVRFQLRRIKDWRMPPNSISVARNGMWGNPFYIRADKGLYERKPSAWEVRYKEKLIYVTMSEVEARQRAVELFATWFNNAIAEPGTFLYQFRQEYGWQGFQLATVAPNLLRGKNLGCFCRSEDVCHGLIILQRANPGMTIKPPDGQQGIWPCSWCGTLPGGYHNGQLHPHDAPPVQPEHLRNVLIIRAKVVKDAAPTE